MQRSGIMKRSINENVIKAFIKGNAFAKVLSKNGFYKFVNEVSQKDKRTIVDVPESMINDFGVNKLSKEYYLVYFIGNKTIHCADKEFFDFVYKTETPFIQNGNKILWFEV